VNEGENVARCSERRWFDLRGHLVVELLDDDQYSVRVPSTCWRQMHDSASRIVAVDYESSEVSFTESIDDFSRRLSGRSKFGREVGKRERAAAKEPHGKCITRPVRRKAFIGKAQGHLTYPGLARAGQEITEKRRWLRGDSHSARLSIRQPSFLIF
jgi:hypothetical protein